jgi:hypothetical protein
VNGRCEPLLSVLAGRRALADLDLPGWDRLLRQAGRAGLLSRVALEADASGVTERVAEPVQRHLVAARTLAERQRRAVFWEAHKLDQALAPLHIPVVLLKGAAYLLADLPPARGRLFADVDILVPKAALGRVEATLRLHGWHGTHHSAYDQRYYREWMHELPPLTHIRRQTHLDVHHNLLPETARLKTRPELVIEASRPLDGFAALRVPALEDLVLHSATHLFHEGEWEHALRDLADLDGLLRHGGGRGGWWDALRERAEALNLVGPLALALRYCDRLLGTPLPDTMWVEAGRSLSRFAWPLRDALFLRGFSLAHGDCGLRGTGFAAFVLYVRAHALRMPARLLVPHLVRKAWPRQNANEA